MVEDHRHSDDGSVIVIEENSDLEATELVTDSAVEIEKIRADKEIQLAKINRGLSENLAETELEALRAENAVLKDQLAAFMPAPEPEPEPIVIVDDSPAEEEAEVMEEETLPEPEPLTEAPAKRQRVGLGMW